MMYFFFCPGGGTGSGPDTERVPPDQAFNLLTFDLNQFRRSTCRARFWRAGRHGCREMVIHRCSGSRRKLPSKGGRMARFAFLLTFAGLVFNLLCSTEAQAQYLGCFKDNSSRDIAARHWSSGSMTVGKCVADCRSRGYRYAGVQYYTHCFCGNSYGRLGRASNCTAKCGGNKSQTCGGSWANSVYDTGATGGGNTNKQAFCQRYSNTAISKQRQNLSRRCGFGGGRWQLNYNNHYNWCLQVSSASANSETNARSAQLQQCRPAQNRLFRSRWDKVGGPGGGWTTGWVPNHTQQVCGHQHLGCRCGAGYCGNYRSGAQTYWWPNGCQGPRWTIRCTSVPQ